MSDDDTLMQFAAEKMGVELEEVTVLVPCPDGMQGCLVAHYEARYFVLKDGQRVSEFRLTSWELLGEGLIKASENRIYANISAGEVYMYQNNEDGEWSEFDASIEFDEIKETPRAFWTCWQKLDEQMKEEEA